MAIFNLTKEHYGFYIATMVSIIKVQQITNLTHIPSFMEEVTSLCDMVLPIIDLRKRDDLPLVEATQTTRRDVVNLSENKKVVMIE
jgi:purine-binding chemotaxis protein CheW